MTNDQWFNIKEALPIVEPNLILLSVNVMVKTTRSKTHTAFYDYREKHWIDFDTAKIVKNVVAWQPLPQLEKDV